MSTPPLQVAPTAEQLLPPPAVDDGRSAAEELESRNTLKLAVGAVDVAQRSTDEVAVTLKSYDLSRHRMRAVDRARVPVAVVLTVCLVLSAVWAARRATSLGGAVADAFGPAR